MSVLAILGEWTTAAKSGWDVVGLAALIASVLAYLYFGLRLAWIDARTHVLPNRLMFPWAKWAAALLVVAGLAHGAPDRVFGALAGGVVLFGAYLLLHLVQRNGMGMGDVKLAFVLGLYLGFVSWWHVLWGTLLAFVLGSLFALGGMIAGKMGRKSAIPFGPFMIVGALVALTIGR